MIVVQRESGRYLLMTRLLFFLSRFPCCYSPLFDDRCPDLPQISICQLISRPWWHLESRISGNRRKILQPARPRTQDSQLDEERTPHCAYGFRLDYWRPRCNPFFHTNSLIWRLVDSSSTNPCSADVMVFLPSRDNYPFDHPSAFSLIATKLSDRCYSPSALQNTRLTTTRHAIQRNC